MRQPGRVLFAILIVAYIAAGMWTTRRVTATGDEVTYLMAADALVHGEGLDLTARWLALDGASYSPGEPVPPDEFARTTAPSRTRTGNYPIHDLGVPLLLALPLAVGGRAGAVLVVAIAMALAVALGVRVARSVGLDERRAMLAAAGIALSVPAVTYSGQVFADSLAPVPIGIALAAMTRALPRWMFAPALAALPVLHVRYWPIVLGLVVAGAVLLRPDRREAARWLASIGVVGIGLAAIGLTVYGLPLPHAGFLLFFVDRRVPIETYSGAAGIIGLFVDRAFGLFPAAPLGMLLFVGAGIALRRPAERPLVLAFVPYLVLVPFVDWTGGFSPQARYLAPLVPLAVLLLARSLAWKWAMVAALPLVLWTLAQSAIYVAAPWLRYDAYGVPPLADRAWSMVPHFTPSVIFPLFGSEGATTALTLVWCGVLVGLFALGLLSVKGPRLRKPGE